MDENYIAYISYLGGAACFAALTLMLAYLCKQKLIHPFLIVASLCSMAWQLAIAANYHSLTLPREGLLLLETLRYASWIIALLVSLQFASGQQLLPKRFRAMLHSMWLLSFAIIISLTVLQHPLVNDSDLLIWNSLLLAMAGLIAVEQLYRNVRQQRMMKLLSLCAGALFAYDIYLFSFSLVFNEIEKELWQARGAVNGLAALLLTLGGFTVARAKPQRTRFSVSRPVAYYTTSISVAGGFLALIAIGGYYVQLHGGRWGNVVQTAIFFAALVTVLTLFISTTVRSKINVWINKNFFRHKYDYRQEWLHIINSLTHGDTDVDPLERAISVVASIFKSQGGGLWLEDSGVYRPVQALDMPLPDASHCVSTEAAFCKIMQQQEWVFSTHTSLPNIPEDINKRLPDWVKSIPNLWLVLPLLTEERLLGFIILKEPEGDATLTWEDLDLLKTVGRQVASYLDRHAAAEQLARSQQFDAFNKLTAFIMHDLKNLIAQQALLVENAAKHKDNPAFIEDTIKTIDNSVGRMSNLLKKLQQQEVASLETLKLHTVLIDAIKKCQENQPSPSLRLETQSATITADRDHLTMILANIIKNAQDATASNGFIDVTLRQAGNNAIITVEDNGAGMDSDFIQNRLFKPFDTTKSGKGMGIGVYQTREFITALGGKVDVESVVDEGTTFTITIPVSVV